MKFSQNSWSSVKSEYSVRRFTAVGTRSRFAIRTVAYVPPFEAGSAGMQDRTTVP